MLLYVFFVINFVENFVMIVKLIYVWIVLVSMLVSFSFNYLMNRNIYVVFFDCKIYFGQRCEVYCKECYELICIKCIIGCYKIYDVSELEELVEIRKREIEKEVEELEFKIILKFQEVNVMIFNKIDYVVIEYVIFE